MYNFPVFFLYLYKKIISVSRIPDTLNLLLKKSVNSQLFAVSQIYTEGFSLLLTVILSVDFCSHPLPI